MRGAGPGPGTLIIQAEQADSENNSRELWKDGDLTRVDLTMAKTALLSPALGLQPQKVGSPPWLIDWDIPGARRAFRNHGE